MVQYTSVFKIRNKIQPVEYSKGGGIRWCTLQISDDNLRLWNVNHNDDGTRNLNWNSGNADNKYNTNNKFAFRLRNSFHFFLVLSCGGVFVLSQRF